MNAYQDLAVLDHRLGDVLESQDTPEVSIEPRAVQGVVSEESVDLVARESLQNLADSRVPQFVPLFVGRFTRQRLQELTGFRPRVGMRKEMYSDESTQDRRRTG